MDVDERVDGVGGPDKAGRWANWKNGSSETHGPWGAMLSRFPIFPTDSVLKIKTRKFLIKNNIIINKNVFVLF